MREKLFKIDTTSEIGHIYINNQDGEHMSWIEVENTLNEQQDQINSLILSIKAKDRHLKNQQTAIKKLQDLCGESDGENAKLRIENKKLKAKLKEKEEDERLYAKEILELRETNKEHIKFKSLGGNY